MSQFFRRTETYAQIFACPRYFADFVKGDLDPRDREYEEFPSLQILNKRVSEFVNDFSIRTPGFEFIVFQDAIEHICKICRVLRMPKGHMMLIGVGGSGKQTLSKISAFICHKKLFTISTNKNYKHFSFREDLKSLFKQTGGLKPEPTLFLLPDTSIIHESFLEDINNLLNNGEIPNLYNSEEIEEIEYQLKSANNRSENTFEEFLKRSKNNLNVLLCMSPANSFFRQRIRMFPSLINCCTLSWFTS